MDTRQPPAHPIFVWENAQPCQIFVEATSVRERPKLVRRIVKSGGNLVNSIRDAEILLAENNTKEALNLLEGWQEDKVVLSTRWVGSCLDQNRFLGAQHQWGGHQLTRESLIQSISTQADESEEDSVFEQIVTKPSRSKAPGPPKSDPLPHQFASNSFRSETQLQATPEGRPNSEQSTFSSSKAPGIPASQPELVVPFHQDHSPPLPSEPGPSLSHMQYPHQSQASIQPSFFPSMFNSMFQQSQQHPPLPLQPNPIPQFGFGSFPQMVPYSQFNPTQLQLLQQLMLGSQALSSQTSEYQLSGIQQQMPQQLLSQEQQQTQTVDMERPTPEDVMSSDTTYLSPEDDDPEPHASREHKRKGRSQSEPYSDEIQTAIRSKPMPSKVTAENQGLFVDNSGLTRKFYIMVDLKNRKGLLRIAKKHHGVIVSEMDQADYVILNNRSNQFQQLLNLLPASKVALSPTWLEACDSEGRVVEMAPFVIDVTSGVGLGAARKRGLGTKATKVETADCESEEEITSHPQSPISAMRPQRRRGSMSQATHLRSRSPSPPHNVVEFNKGKNVFTPEDRAWFFEYLRFKLERDPDASMTSLIKAVGQKASHHSARSWDSSWRKNWREDMEALKKDIAQLRLRVTSSKARHPSPQPSPNTSATPSTTPKTPWPVGEDYVLHYPGGSSPVRTPTALRPPPSNTPMSRSGSGGQTVHSPSDIMSLQRSITPDSQRFSGGGSQHSPYDMQPPPNSAPVSQSSTQASPTGLLKRKGSLTFGHAAGTPQSKKPKVQPVDIIDVDSYPDDI